MNSMHDSKCSMTFSVCRSSISTCLYVKRWKTGKRKAKTTDQSTAVRSSDGSGGGGSTYVDEGGCQLGGDGEDVRDAQVPQEVLVYGAHPRTQVQPGQDLVRQHDVVCAQNYIRQPLLESTTRPTTHDTRHDTRHTTRHTTHDTTHDTHDTHDTHETVPMEL